MKVLLIGEADVLSLCKMPECIDAMRGAFVFLDRGVVSDPLRTRIAVSEIRNILVMPSMVRDRDPQISLKVVSIYPDIGEGKRSVNATVLLVDGSDGQVRGRQSSMKLSRWAWFELGLASSELAGLPSGPGCVGVIALVH